MVTREGHPQVAAQPEFPVLSYLTYNMKNTYHLSIRMVLLVLLFSLVPTVGDSKGGVANWDSSTSD